MSWDLLGGNPAPGSPQSVDAAATVLAQVADLAGEARRTLIRSTGGLAGGDWKGDAADAFRQGVVELPERLGEVEQSYAEASGALQSFREALEHAQYEAQAALRMAEQAAADRDAAHRKRDAARGDATSLRASRLSAAGTLTRLLGQRAVTLDPAQRAALDAPIAAAKARVNRLHADEDAADRTADHHAATADEAEDRLHRAQERAEAIKHDLRSRADAAIRALAAAEREAHLPSFLERLGSDAKDLIVTYGPRVANLLQITQTVFEIAALVFPPGAVVFGAAALVCGGTALILSTSAHALSPEGMTGAAWAELGLGTLSLVGGGFALGGVLTTARAAKAGVGAVEKATLLARAGQLEKAAKALDKVHEVGDFGKDAVENYREEGWSGVVKAGGSFVIGKVGEKAAGKLLESGVGLVAKNSTVQTRLNSMSTSLGQRGDALVFDLPVDGQATRSVQSLLGGTRDGLSPDALKDMDELTEGLAEGAIGLADGVLEVAGVEDDVSELTYDALSSGVGAVASHASDLLDSGLDALGTGMDALNTGVDAVNSGLEAVNSGMDAVSSGLGDAASRVTDAVSRVTDAVSGVDIDVDIDIDLDVSWGHGR